jgi:hypothetical protein
LSSHHGCARAGSVKKLFLDGVTGRFGGRTSAKGGNRFCGQCALAEKIPGPAWTGRSGNVFAPLAGIGLAQAQIAAVPPVATRFQSGETIAGCFASTPVAKIASEKDLPKDSTAIIQTFCARLRITCGVELAAIADRDQDLYSHKRVLTIKLADDSVFVEFCQSLVIFLSHEQFPN